MNGQIAVARVTASAPGVEGQSHAAGAVAGSILPSRMPFLFPAHQIGSDAELFAVGILPLLREVEILAEEFHRVQVELGREVIQSAHREDRSLRMIGRTPGSCGTDVVADRSVLLTLVGNPENVRNGRHAATTGATCAPGVGLPGDEGAVLFRGNFHASIRGRPSPGNLQFRVTLEHDSDRLAASLPGNFGGKNSPAIRGELAAESSADVVLVHTNVGGGNLERLRTLGGVNGKDLRRDVSEKMVIFCPLR